MKYEFGESIAQLFTQSPQRNPIQWEILKKVKEGKFIPQYGLFRCKDYFNDVAYKRNNPKASFTVYGFNIGQYKPDSEGVYVRVHFIQDQKSFVENIETINEHLTLQEMGWFLEYIPLDETTGLFLLPDAMFKNTYTVSLITWMIRLANYKIAFKDFDDFFNNEVRTKNNDCGSANNYVKYILEHGFKHPLMDQYIYYYNNDYNDKSENKKKLDGHAIHNCGIANWWTTYTNCATTSVEVDSFFKKMKVAA
jgi:hypothetical protein